MTIDWELSGVADGRLDRPLSGDFVAPPQTVALDDSGEWLMYSMPSTGLGEFIKPSDTLLFDFVELADKEPQEIASYARTWGGLALCADHKLPMTHDRGPIPVDIEKRGNCQPLTRRIGGQLYFLEPINVWGDFAREARAMLNIASSLHQGKVGEESDWPLVFKSSEPSHRKVARMFNLEPFYKSMGGMTKDDRLKYGGLYISSCVNWWIALADVSPFFYWTGKSKAFHPFTGIGVSYFHHHKLFGALAMRLMLAVSRSQGIAICSYCGTHYFPRRKPRTDRRNYCDRCGRKASMRIASQKYRAKKK